MSAHEEAGNQECRVCRVTFDVHEYLRPNCTGEEKITDHAYKGCREAGMDFRKVCERVTGCHVPDCGQPRSAHAVSSTEPKSEESK